MQESKKLLIGLGIIAVICSCIAGAAYFAFRKFESRLQNAVNGDPTSVARARQDIAEFDIPEGYQPFALNMFNYDMLTLTPVSAQSGMTIMLMQYTGLTAGNSEQMEEQLRRAISQQGGQAGTSMKLVDTYEETIRAQTVTVSVSEGQFQGLTMRQWSTVFQGNKGPTIVMVQGITEAWDDQLLDDFIKSIK